MKVYKLIAVMVFGVLMFFPFSVVSAQEEKNLETERKMDNNRRPNVLAELNLTREQIREVRRLNQENKFVIRLAQERLRAANRNLDDAIYADSIDDSELQTRIREVQSAQNEIVRARSASEISVRRVLSVQQLAKFRELRRKFMEDKEMRPNQRRRNFRNFSNRRFNNRRQTPAPGN